MNGQVQDSINNLVGDWYAYGNWLRKININDTITFSNEYNCKDSCEYIKWSFKSKGDIEMISINSHINAEITTTGGYKWISIKKTNKLIINSKNFSNLYLILAISKERLKMKRIK